MKDVNNREVYAGSICKNSYFSKSEDDECVVYGPINKEPDEKLYPWKYERKDSGVRRLSVVLPYYNIALI